MFVARVKRTVSAAHHNGPPDNKCHRNHGHDWKIDVTFEYSEDQLDLYGWGPDFGAIKSVIDTFDHQDLNEVMTKPPSAEYFAMQLAADLEAAFEERNQLRVVKLIVHEGNKNAVIYFPGG